MRKLRKMAVLQAACLLMTGTAAALPVLTGTAMTASAAQYEEIHSGDFSARKYSDGIVITGYFGKATALEIPAELDGLPVRGIYSGYDNSIFRGKGEVASVTLPDSLQAIGAGAFMNLRNMEEITIPDSVTSIGEKAFYDCGFLTKVKLPKKLDVIPASCFENCSYLKEITMPEALTEIQTNAFKKCVDLKSVRIPQNTKLDKDAFRQCESMTEVTLGAGSVLSGEGIFMGCKKLETMHLPNSVTTIPNYTFEGCHALASVRIPRFCTRVGESAFANCRSLKEITLHENVKYVWENAFLNCTQLEKITFFSSSCQIDDSASTICNEKKDGKYVFSGTICGLSKSTANSYADNYKVKFEALDTETAPLTGDGNCNGEVSVDDAQFVLKYYVNCSVAILVQDLTVMEKHNCDVNDDGKVDVIDAQCILVWYVNNKVAEKPLSWQDLLRKY
ncbi:MAG: leucine-rich repeat protein [Oscillospiraceae bacterium]|nr:leucine-rich repeat protein [Oscillospiraceae bacterium]